MRGIVVTAIALLLAVTSASAFVMIDHWYASPQAFTGGFVSNSVTLDIKEVDPNPNLKVAFTIPELGVRSVRGPYNPSGLLYTTVHRSLEIPYDAEPGEYVVRIYITDKHGNKRIKHRFIEIE